MSHRPSNKAKPNTRFLGRIIKETTSHNAALLAKEAAEAQARLDDLTEAEEKKRRKFNPSSSDLRRRQLGDISSILQGRKRHNGAERHDESKQRDGGGKDKGQSRDRSRDRDRRRSRLTDRHPDKEDGRRSHRKHDDRTTDDRRRRQDRSCSPRQRDRRHRDRSPLGSSSEDDRLRHSRSHRGKSGKDGDLLASESSRRKSYGRLREDDDTSSKKNPSRTGDRLAEGDDSNPLEELIGPAPPPRAPIRTRGRGAIRGAAAMDSRFSEDYDPASDVQPEPAETEDWEGAAEAYRDRQKWKQQGADRLREAGFTDEQIKTWEKGGEKDIDDVRWSKAGEKREW
ncbi:hypothetical protein C8A00DRAFT_42419 [Chaetomidium leptoderma]|uniref:Pre-mRNA-splicing factor 38B n=1 Tax=Chaetomidium leptoderma TaxID=669021 RepID=A0AAN6VP05_9PEZI|nr:hypothetical protein C8A00DRAFT_42419 [Chaetomidium leptoderma]